jgi:hypothetical protein
MGFAQIYIIVICTVLIVISTAVGESARPLAYGCCGCLLGMVLAEAK